MSVEELLEAAARRHKVPSNLLKAVAWQESAWDPRASSFDGGHGKGVMQIDDRFHEFARTPDVWDPAKNIDYGAKYLAGLHRQSKDWRAAVRRYNGSGPAAERYAETVLALERSRPWQKKAAKPELGPWDIHLVLNGNARKLKLFDARGKLRYTVEARGYGAKGPGYDWPGGDTPPGLYRCGEPARTSEPAFGPWWVDLEEMEDQERGRGRAGIGVHGGGSGLPDAFAPHQGWTVTMGCIRLQNADLERAVESIRYTQQHDGTAWLTVSWAA